MWIECTRIKEAVERILSPHHIPFGSWYDFAEQNMSMIYGV